MFDVVSRILLTMFLDNSATITLFPPMDASRPCGGGDSFRVAEEASAKDFFDTTNVFVVNFISHDVRVISI